MHAYVWVCVHVFALESFGTRGSLETGTVWVRDFLLSLPVTTYLILHVVRSSLHRKWQEANQKIQELQAGQDARAEQEQKIKVSWFVSGPGRAGRCPSGGSPVSTGGAAAQGGAPGIWGQRLLCPVPFTPSVFSCARLH